MPGCDRRGSFSRPADAAPAWRSRSACGNRAPGFGATDELSGFHHRRRWRRSSEIGHELIEPFLMLGFAQAGQVRVNGGDDRAAVAEVDLNLAEVLALLQQMRRVGVAQRLLILLINCLRAESNTATTRATARKSE